MKFLLLMILMMAGVTGCSELQVIGKATVREISSDGINVERDTMELPAKLAEAEKVRVAAAEAMKNKKPERKKLLWERQ